MEYVMKFLDEYPGQRSGIFFRIFLKKILETFLMDILVHKILQEIYVETGKI